MQCRLFYCIMKNEQRGMITFILAVCGNVDYIYTFPPSPPSRAAWIEIRDPAVPGENAAGRRLHGRRGLKFKGWLCFNGRGVSPPSRAAWIEINSLYLLKNQPSSRRLHGRRGLKSGCGTAADYRRCRRLHGRRGLKFHCLYPPDPSSRVAAFTGGVD